MESTDECESINYVSIKFVTPSHSNHFCFSLSISHVFQLPLPLQHFCHFFLVLLRSNDFFNIMSKEVAKVKSQYAVNGADPRNNNNPLFQRHIQPLVECMEPKFDAFKPEVSQAIETLFKALDTGNKGYLSSDEWAWLSQLDLNRHTDMRLACNIVARRGSPIQIAKLPLKVQLNLQAEMSNAHGMRLLSLPHELSIFQSSQPLTGLNGSPVSGIGPGSFPIFAADHPASLLFAQSKPQFERMLTVTPVESIRPKHFFTLTQTQQQTMVKKWYTLRHHLDYMRIFHTADIKAMRNERDSRQVGEVSNFNCNGCTLPAFEAFLRRRFILNPIGTAQWLTRAALVLQGAHAHPTAELWKVRTAPPTVAHVVEPNSTSETTNQTSK